MRGHPRRAQNAQETMSPKDKTATSACTAADIDDHVAGGIGDGHPAPMAAAMGSAIKPALRAPADKTDCRMARFSTGVAPCGTQTMIFGLKMSNAYEPCG